MSMTAAAMRPRPRSARLQASLPQLRLLRHAQSCGQSAAIRSGVRAARGRWIATLDGDGQNDPADIPALWRIARRSAGDAATADRRASRAPPGQLVEAAGLAHRQCGAPRALLRDDTPDTGCGLKLFPRALFLDLPYFDHMHRFLPALVLREGGIVRSVPVNHRPRQRGISNYGVLDRLWVGIADLFGVIWLRRRLVQPVVVEDAMPCEERAEDARPAEVSARATSAEPVR